MIRVPPKTLCAPPRMRLPRSSRAARPSRIPPELASFAPDSAAWQCSTGSPTMMAGRAVVLYLYLKPAQAVAFFVLSTT